MGTNDSRKRANLVFAVEDPYKNIVRLERHTWEKHIVLKHSEVRGATEADLRNLINSPDRMREIKTDKDFVGFESGMLRGLVLYDDVEFRKGETFGRVTTIYPDTGLPSTWGSVIWERGSGTNK